jgi:hypothetical protein
MTGEMQDESWMDRRWTLILAMAVRSTYSPKPGYRRTFR